MADGAFYAIKPKEKIFWKPKKLQANYSNASSILFLWEKIDGRQKVLGLGPSLDGTGFGLRFGNEFLSFKPITFWSEGFWRKKP